MSTIDAGEHCLVGRVRAKGPPDSWVAIGVAQTAPEVAAQGINATLGSTFTERSFACRLPESFTVGSVWLNTNKQGDTDDFVLEIDYAEIDVVPCSGTEGLCYVE